MKCKPGDLCQVVGNVSGDECRAKCIGRYVIRVKQCHSVEILRPGWSGPAWTYEGGIKRCPTYGMPCTSLAVFPDADLQPLPPEQDIAMEEILDALDELTRMGSELL